MKTRQFAKQRERGFTLIEVMVVVLILGLLATAVAINAFPQYEKAKDRTAMLDVVKINQAVKIFYVQRSRLPTCQDLIDPPPILEGYQHIPKDPWNNPYVIRPGETPGTWEVLCWGPDGTAGTPDDISSESVRDRKGQGG